VNMESSGASLGHEEGQLTKLKGMTWRMLSLNAMIVL
jgi:hypothetical protein